MNLSKKLDPYWLRPGTLVGPWKVKGYHAGGSFGAVFHAVLAGRELRGPVALKVAWWPGDPRFQRESTLLSRIQHPSVPKWMGSGEWQNPGGAAYPYLVMEWVEGVPLYEWAEQLNPSSQDVSRVLARVARALEVTHAAGALHRDVKGSNILVTSSWRQAFLIDYGAGTYAGASPLTHDGLPPGTDCYRGPEAFEFELRRPRNAPAAYPAQPTDDVFSLGVSAYRLVTGQYLPPVDVREDQNGTLHLVRPEPQPPHELNPRVSSELSTLILRMLAARPEERPSARALAETLERSAKNPVPGADRPLFAPKQWDVSPKQQTAERRLARWLEELRAPRWWALVRTRVPAWTVACAMLVGVLAALAIGWALQPAREGVTPRTADAAPRTPEPVGLGDTSLTAPMVEVEEPSGRERIKLPVPKEPFKGQRRAPRCRPTVEVVINGGCWVQIPTVKPPCGDQSYEWKGSCYIPTLSPTPPPTSEPQ